MKWIEVSERLPEPGEIVDIYNVRDGRVTDVKYDGDEWISLYMAWCGIVTHWMPLPPAPKED